jgi:hypothetical protein
VINPTICPECFQPNEPSRSYCWKCNRSLYAPASTGDYLRFFGLTSSSSNEDLKTAYHHMATKFHPDKNPGDREADAQFKFVAEAYEALLPIFSRKQAQPVASNTSSLRGSGAGTKPESPDIIDKRVVSFLSQMYSPSETSRAGRIFRKSLVALAGLTALRDLIYGIHLYRVKPPLGFTLGDFRSSVGFVLGLLIFAVALIILADQMPRTDVMPYSPMTVVDLDPRVWTFLGWVLLWVMLLLTPFILQNALVRK